MSGHDWPSDELLAMLPLFEDPAFEPSIIHKSWKDEKGVIHMGWYEYVPLVDAFLRQLGDLPPGLARWYPESPEHLATADRDQIRSYLLWTRRDERISDGSVDQAFRSGRVVAALRRLRELRGSP